MSLPNLSSFRGITFNEDTTGNPGRTAEPVRQAVTSAEHAFSATGGDGMNILETGGMLHNELAINVAVASNQWSQFKANIGKIGTLTIRGTTWSNEAIMTEIGQGQYVASADVFLSSAKWIF